MQIEGAIFESERMSLHQTLNLWVPHPELPDLQNYEEYILIINYLPGLRYCVVAAQMD